MEGSQGSDPRRARTQTVRDLVGRDPPERQDRPIDLGTELSEGVETTPGSSLAARREDRGEDQEVGTHVDGLSGAFEIVHRRRDPGQPIPIGARGPGTLALRPVHRPIAELEGPCARPVVQHPVRGQAIEIEHRSTTSADLEPETAVDAHEGSEGTRTLRDLSGRSGALRIEDDQQERGRGHGLKGTQGLAQGTPWVGEEASA